LAVSASESQHRHPHHAVGVRFATSLRNPHQLDSRQPPGRTL